MTLPKKLDWQLRDNSLIILSVDDVRNPGWVVWGPEPNTCSDHLPEYHVSRDGQHLFLRPHESGTYWAVCTNGLEGFESCQIIVGSEVDVKPTWSNTQQKIRTIFADMSKLQQDDARTLGYGFGWASEMLFRDYQKIPTVFQTTQQALDAIKSSLQSVLKGSNFDKISQKYPDLAQLIAESVETIAPNPENTLDPLTRDALIKFYLDASRACLSVCF